MSNVLELTKVVGKGNRIEQKGVDLDNASKVRLTPQTYNSLKKNIKSNMPKILEAFNSEYNKILNAYVIEETAQAEQRERDALNVSTAEETKRKARIDEEDRLAKITSAGAVKRRSKVLNFDAQKLTGRFGTLGQNFGVNVKKGYTPKALSVPSFYKKVYQTISKKIDLYELADTDPSLFGDQETEVKKANWRGLFDSVSAPVVNEVNIALNGNEEESVVIPTQEVQEGLTKGDITQRSLIGQLGDEISQIDIMINSLGGDKSPFNKGLVERKKHLLNMLADMTGVPSIAQGGTLSQAKQANTAFQDYIDDIMGVKEPISEQEHDESQREMDNYYSNPDVWNIIDDLREKQILSSFNKPENFDKINAAEKKANEQIVAELLKEKEESKKIESIKVEAKPITVEPLIPSVPEVVETTKKEPKVDKAAEEARKAEEKAKKEAEERESIIMGAEEQARILFEQNQLDNILLGAKEQAEMLNKDIELAKIYEGAEEQAKMLHTLNNFIDEKEKEELRAQEEAAERERLAREQEEKTNHEKIVAGAKEQAKLLNRQNELAEIKQGAEEQARKLQMVNYFIEKKELEELRAQKAKAEEKLAREKEERANYEKIVTGAKEQAKLLNRQNELAEIKAGAEEQAAMLNSVKEEAPKENSENFDIANQIVYQNSTEDFIKSGAAEQAILIEKAIERANIKESARKQAEMLLAKEEQVAENPEDLLAKKLGPNVIVLDESKDKYLREESDARKIKLRDVHFKGLKASLNLGRGSRNNGLGEFGDELVDAAEPDFLIMKVA